MKNLKKFINEEDTDSLEGDGLRTIIPSNIIDIYTRLELLLGPKLSGPYHILSEASSSIDELNEQNETQSEQHYRTVLDNFHNFWIELPVKF